MPQPAYPELASAARHGRWTPANCRRAWPFIPEAALAAYEGMPAVLVLELEKR